MQSVPLHLVAGLAALGAAVLTLALAALGRVAGLRPSARLVAAGFAALFFVALTQLPLPDPSLLKAQCPLIGAQPNWIPLYTADQIVREWRAFLSHPDGVPLELLSHGPDAVLRWLRHRTWGAVLRGGWALPALMNLLVCLPIGALLWPQARRLRAALLAGVALSLAVELTQITATWGLYPCAYRKFDVDDLILNSLGVALGFAMARCWSRRARMAPPA
jgi:hypothetical protein